MSDQDMDFVLHRADSRGYFDFGWLKTYHTFSFGSYVNPRRVRFGALRVLNDDTVEPGMGFGTHPHNDMEIVTIPLRGAVAHKDSMGNGTTIRPGEIQVMSAGTGITHSEFNPDPERDTELLQIWILPYAKGLTPRYDQKFFQHSESYGSFRLLVGSREYVQSLTGESEQKPLWIQQDAFFSWGNFSTGDIIRYTKYREENLVYTFLVSGSLVSESAVIGGEKIHMGKRDGLGSVNPLSWVAQEKSEVLVMEVPEK